jgi:aqualysin 1
MKRNGIVALTFSLAASATAGEILKGAPGTAVPRSYIVVLKPDVAVKAGSTRAGLTVSQISVTLATLHGGSATRFYEYALQGFAVRMSEEAAHALAGDPRVAYVQENRIHTIHATQSPVPSWGLDRLDQRNSGLDGRYTHRFTGAGVHAYIIDTGVRGTHREFTGRMGNGFGSIPDGNGSNDCHGHGTHVAGTVGGATYGVAKGVTLHAVRVLACNGSGTTEQVIAGVDWVMQNHVKPAVANMSLGGGVDPALDEAVARSIGAGVVYAIAAGNSSRDACSESPARVPEALTVGSTEERDLRSSFSNIGRCVDLFAPGSRITSAWNSSDTGTHTISGTSMATPHVAGVVALYLQEVGTQSAAAVSEALLRNATPGIIIDVGANSPNRLLHSLFGGVVPTPPPDPPPPPGINVALNKRATGSTPCTPSQGPEKAVNGSVRGGIDDKWCSAAADVFLQVDLGASFTISSFVVRHASAGGEPAALNTRSFFLQTSNDGTSFSSVLTVPVNASGVTYHFLSTPVTTRHVRFRPVDRNNAGDPAARVYEFEVYSPGSPGQTPTPTVTPIPMPTPTPGPTATPTPTPRPMPNSFEAEAAGNTLSGTAVVRTCAACSGGRKVGFIGNGAANFVTVTNVNVRSAGSYILTVHYLLSGTRTFFVSVNGGPAVPLRLTGTSWSTVATGGLQVNLRAGANTVRFSNPSAFAPDLDRIVVTPGGPPLLPLRWSSAS